MSGKITVKYFGFGGRGECIRMLLTHAGADFEFDPIENFGESELKQQLEFKQLPAIADENGELKVQTGAILRYVGKKFGYYPEDAEERYMVDSAVDAFEDFFLGLMGVFKARGEEANKAAWTSFIKEHSPKWFDLFEK